jgi:2-methylcitrate dehydratase PrpD
MSGLLTIAALAPSEISARARRMAELSMFDFLVVARAGIDQPVSRIVRELVEAEGGDSVSTIVGGGGRKLPARAAALLNGATAHSLDYDDTNFAHVGHPTVAILPAALAAAEEVDASAAELRDAFLLGAEASCRIGMVLGCDHYERGFHQTATAGAFGATIAAGRIHGLNQIQMRHALSLVSTRASGLKSQFGTMGKPFNAGMAAANGVEAAALAKRGFVSCDDGVGGEQGFVETHSNGANLDGPWLDPPPIRFMFEGTKYKLHACCHGSHAMIEALLAVRRNRSLEPTDIARISVRTHPRWLRVCDLKTPRTGLEAKFSYVFLAAMVMQGIDTASEKIFADALCADPRLHRLAEQVEVIGDETLSDTQCRLAIEFADGACIDSAHDLLAPVPDEALTRGLRDKAGDLLGEQFAESLWLGITSIGRMTAREFAKLLV